MTYLSPLGYLIGIEGVALLRGLREGFADQEYVEARIAEIRAFLDNPELAAAGVNATHGGISVREEYADWAASYDQPGNDALTGEEPHVRAILDELQVGDALDAACGTGRHAAYLASRGHRVIGVDGTPEMLEVARAKLPDVDFRQGDLSALPVSPASVDTIVCALALSYVEDLEPVFKEFARVLRPGGHLVISDMHHLYSLTRPTIAHRPGLDGLPSLLTEYHRPLSHYLAAALPLGFQVRSCAEVGRTSRREDRVPKPTPDGPVPTVLDWDLLEWIPQAISDAMDNPWLVVWHFQLSA